MSHHHSIIWLLVSLVKPRGIKHKIQEEKRRERRIGLAITVAILIMIVFISGFLINSMLNQPSQDQSSTNSTSGPKAAIVDHLSLTAPNQTFKETATNILNQAGYIVDYYAGEKVTVTFYRNLPTHDYGLIILRVHSARGDVSLSLFTSEPYNTYGYFDDQWNERITAMGYTPYSEGDPLYFGIGPKFVTQSMKGRFDNSIIIMMGCHGLTQAEMANAFREKGAKVYISWNGMVSASHTDQATIHLLEHLLIEKQTINQAVTENMKEVGPDPVDDSLLLYYPLEVGDQRIETITSES